MTVLAGVAASPGSAIAPAWVPASRELRLPSGPVADPEAEVARLRAGLARVAERLGERSAAAVGELAEILDAQALMALDPELAAGAERLVRDAATPAARAVVEVGAGYAASLAASDDAYLAARAADVREVCRLVAADLLGVAHRAEPPAAPYVLVADDVGPADLAELDLSAVRGVATESGSRTSHTAIVARALGIPAVVAVPGLLAAVAPDAPVLVDGDAGMVHVAPDAATVERVAAGATTRTAPAPPMPEAITTDGHRVELAVNVGGLGELRAAVGLGAASVGLFRTELAYLHATRPPSEDEQADVLREMAALLGGRRLVVRTFDFGADKLPAFLSGGHREANPALGVRGIRLAQRHPELLAAQLRAVARAAAGGGRLAVMAPMVAGVEDAEWFLDACRTAGCAAAGVEVGVMVEVPSAVLTAAELAERLDFLSIGTNDLGQYLHAADRQEGALSAFQDPFRPALLRAVRTVGEAAAGRAWVGVCGEAAADPRWAAIAVGLGVVELSMGAADLAHVHAELTRRSLAECRAMAEAALAT
jgi:phosphoenolpyruvate-protein phosphotransferase (PTS system enzyme I)